MLSTISMGKMVKHCNCMIMLDELHSDHSVDMLAAEDGVGWRRVRRARNTCFALITSPRRWLRL